MKKELLILMPEFPDVMKSKLALLSDRMVDAIKGDGLDVENGSINLGELDESLRFPLFFANWFCQFDEIFHNLNLVLLDIDQLYFNHAILKGSARRRFYLLIRMYFYEFYRAREVFGTGLKELVSYGVVDSVRVKETRKIFHDAFETTIKIRNTMVHGQLAWGGEAHLSLNQVGQAWDRGYAVHEIESGKRIELNDVLKEISAEYLPTLIDESNRLCHLLQAVFDVCCQKG